MSEVISSFKSFELGKGMQLLLCILSFGMLCLSVISVMFVKCMLVGVVV